MENNNVITENTEDRDEEVLTRGKRPRNEKNNVKQPAEKVAKFVLPSIKSKHDEWTIQRNWRTPIKLDPFMRILLERKRQKNIKS